MLTPLSYLRRGVRGSGDSIAVQDVAAAEVAHLLAVCTSGRVEVETV